MGSSDTAANDGGGSGTPTQKEKKETQGSGKSHPSGLQIQTKETRCQDTQSLKGYVMT